MTPAVVVVSVVRNKNQPTFINLPAVVTLTQNEERGKRVFSVEARDADSKAPFNMLGYSIIGDDDAANYFQIGAEGHITIRGDLKSAPGTQVQYSVCRLSD